MKRNGINICTAGILLTCIIVFAGCKKQNAVLTYPALADYTALQTGKVLLYHLDSTIVDPSGTQLIVSSYLIKDSIGATFMDNTGRPSYQVYRYITDTLNAKPWQPLTAYYVTPAAQAVETVDDNNLRVISMKQPLTEGFSWNGNAYIDTKSYGGAYQYMDGWNFNYQNVNMPFTVLKGTVDSTVTVLQVDELSPPGAFNDTVYQQRNYSLEVYGKGMGLVYKEFLHWTWQPTPFPSQYDADSYGFKLNLIDIK